MFLYASSNVGFSHNNHLLQKAGVRISPTFIFLITLNIQFFGTYIFMLGKVFVIQVTAQADGEVPGRSSESLHRQTVRCRACHLSHCTGRR